MSGEENIVITGFMGTGKSTVGEIVACRLKRKFVDMDADIEARAGKSIPQIFDAHGEAAFRAMERELAEELAAQSSLVIATGGGTLVRTEMRHLMGASAKLICLNASNDAIQRRLGRSDGRPLAGSWEKLLNQRKADYAQIENQIETTGRSPDAIAGDIIARCGQRLHVNTPTGAGYDICIRRGILENISDNAEEFGLGKHVVVVTNDTIAPLYGEQLVSKLPHADLVTVSDGEKYKNLATVAQIYDDLLALGADRGTTLVALGGGVIGDTVGFVAATYMRGLQLIQIPTTLLAMVDSSVGGKAGVDLPQGKNLIGAFKQPQSVIVDTKVLETLSPEHWRCGMAEVIKHGLIARPSLLNPALWTRDRVVELVRDAAQVKIEVVEQDPYERGIRAHLNLGHTFGHAIERVTNYQVPHGEAVAIGIVKAARLSKKLGMIDAELVNRIESILEEIGLPVTIELDPHEWYAAMSTDKKWQTGKSRFVLLQALGEATIVEGLSKEDILAVL